MALNKQKKVRDWCPDESDVPIGTRGLVRCPTCNRRLSPRTLREPSRELEPLGQVIAMRLPPHKAK